MGGNPLTGKGLQLMYMIMFVLDDANKLDKLLENWYEIGIRGVTIVQSTGFFRRQVQRSKLHLTFLIEQISVESEEGNITLFAIVETNRMVEDCLEKTEEIIGNLEGPNTGVFTAWPLSVIKGIQKPNNQGSRE